MERGVSAAQRRTLFEIEREKRWRIWLLFALLLGHGLRDRVGRLPASSLGVALPRDPPVGRR